MVLVRPPRFRVQGSLNLTAHPQPCLEQDRREREWRMHIQGFPDLMVSDNYTSVHILLARTIAPCTPRNIYLLLFLKIILMCSYKAQSSQCRGFSRGVAASSVERRLLPWSTGSGGADFRSCSSRLWSTDSVVAAPWLSCPIACGILLGQGSNPSLPHWQADSLLLSHREALSVTCLCFFIFPNLKKN